MIFWTLLSSVYLIRYLCVCLYGENKQVNCSSWLFPVLLRCTNSLVQDGSEMLANLVIGLQGKK